MTGALACQAGVARNGSYEIAYEIYGQAPDPVVLLVSGLGSQMLSYRVLFCEQLVAAGFRVVRFDNRDVGMSTKTPGEPRAMTDLGQLDGGGSSGLSPYTLRDMAADGIAVLDDVGVERAHVWGMSMGGMIVQTMACEFSDRLISMTSVMSRTGDPDVGTATPEAAALLVAPRPSDLAGAIAMDIDERRLEAGDYFDEVEVTEYLTAQYQRCHHPVGMAFQYAAVVGDGDRTDRLSAVTVPATVIHGEADPLISPSGGRATAAAIPGAKLVMVPGMGHHLPQELWSVFVNELVELASRAG